ncbi:MAG: universal stress protein [Actinomycetota bacterium]
MARIVVGVDGSESSLLALRWAVEEAGPDDQIEAVAVWRPVVGFGSDMAPGIPDPVEFEQYTRAGLEASISVHESRFGPPDVELQPIVLQGHPGRALCHHADGADLLVVGRRGSGGFTGLHLGSVSTTVAHHSPCPAVIVPDSLGDPAEE